MTKREAVNILIQAGVNDVRGQGKGIRETSDEWRIKVRMAIEVMFKHLNKRKMHDNERFNLGL